MNFKTAIVGLTLCAASAYGDTSVTVGGLTSADGDANSGNGYSLPINTGALRMQTLLVPSALPGLSAGMQITGLAFRLSGGLSAVDGASTARFQVGLGTTTLDSSTLSSTSFADNRGTDYLTVYDAPLTVNLPGGATPNPFGTQIVFTTPFSYTGGNLLVEVAQTGFSLSSAEDWFEGSGLLSRFNGLFESTSGPLGLAGSPVYQFTVIAAPIPEPGTSSVLMAASGLGLAFFVRRRRARQAGRR